MVLANIDGKSLTDPAFARSGRRSTLAWCWSTRLRPGVADMDMTRFQLTASIGFYLRHFARGQRMIYDRFFDRYPNSRSSPAMASALPT
jgi:aminocarboxymuconate-semialdehyde decarboxylase